MQVARWADSLPKDKIDKLSFLPTSALYDLSAKSTSEPACEAVLKALEKGERLNVATVRTLIYRNDTSENSAPAAVANTAVGNVEVIPADQVDAVVDEPDIIPPPPKPKKPRKPTKAQLERQEREAERAKERNEVCNILRKLSRDDLLRLSDLHLCWMASNFEATAEWLFVLAEIDPDLDWLGEIEFSNLNTEENRRRLEQIKADADATQAAEPHESEEEPAPATGRGRPDDPDDNDDPLVIPAAFKRGAKS